MAGTAGSRDSHCGQSSTTSSQIGGTTRHIMLTTLTSLLLLFSTSPVRCQQPLTICAISTYDLDASLNKTKTFTMTRTHKATDRDHVGLANGTASPEEHLPRYFGKSGYVGNNPSETKKQGGGKGNWGRDGFSELEDCSYNPSKARRRTNSMSSATVRNALRTKFEALDPEVIEYEEALHGPPAEDVTDHSELEKVSTTSSVETIPSANEEVVAEKRQ